MKTKCSSLRWLAGFTLLVLLNGGNAFADTVNWSSTTAGSFNLNTASGWNATPLWDNTTIANIKLDFTVAPVFTPDGNTTALTALNGVNPNGTSSLFLADLNAGGQSTLVSWGLEISVVPEPANVALAVFGGLLALGGLRRAWRMRSCNGV